MTEPNRGESKSGPNGKIAIIGMSCLFPDAPDLASFWTNIIYGRDSIRDVSAAEWDVERYFDSSSTSFGRVNCQRGGFITDLAEFDPLKHGIMPTAIRGADADQFLAMHVATEAMKDAGYGQRGFDGRRAEVILGRVSAPGGGAINMIQHGQTIEQMLDVIAAVRPDYDAEQLSAIREKLLEKMPPCNADTIPGVMPNILAGRIARRLGINGRSLIVDAACASSLIAVETGVRDLLSGACDLVLAGGLHVNSFACFYQMFAGLGALSASEQIRPFDSNADGTLLGEGLGVVVLKRLEDAQRDGDRTYAIIAGIGTSSDGYGGSILAPSLEGEALALSRAYEMAGVSPRTVQLIEAHGTGTPVGDLVEMQAIARVFLPQPESTAAPGPAGEPSSDHTPWCALGSVKSMIGHCQAASGVAGLIKTALSLYHKVLPPTLNVSEPNNEIDWSSSPCYINNRTRPWIHAGFGDERPHPRRAAVSAFGFGGINAHAVLEEHVDSDSSHEKNLVNAWQSEICIFGAGSKAELSARLRQVNTFIERNPNVALKDVSWTINCAAPTTPEVEQQIRLAVVASTVADLRFKLSAVEERLSEGSLPGNMDGVYFGESDRSKNGKLAFILPGLGAAYPNMLADLCLHFPEVRAVFDFVDLLAHRVGDTSLPSRMVFPSPFQTSGTAVSDALSLASAHSAVVLVLMAEWAIFTLLSNLGVKPDTVMGCSTGEFAALAMNGSVDIVQAAELFYRLSAAVSKAIPAEQLQNLRSLKVHTSAEKLASLQLQLNKQIYLSADLGPAHIIVSGQKEAIEEASALLQAEKIDFTRLPFAIPYHTPLVAGRLDRRQQQILDLPFASPALKSWSCSMAEAYPSELTALREIATGLFEKPIQLRKTIEAMYEDGVRTFVEVGPKGNLTALIGDILPDKPHRALASNLPGVPSFTQIQHVLAALFCQGTDLHLEYLYRHRNTLTLDFEQLAGSEVTSPSNMRLDLSYPELRLDQLPAVAAAKPVIAESPQTTELPSETPPGEPDVMTQYLRSMSEFHARLMSVEERVMSEYLQSSSAATATALAPAVATTVAPFLRGAAIERLPQRVVIQRKFSLQEDLYLLDHAIGGIVSTLDNKPTRVYLVPLMVTLEIMAEAAALLAPAGALTRMEQIRAYKRIKVDSAGVDLQVTASFKTGDQRVVSVEVRKPETNQSASFNQSSNDEDLLASCDVIFDHAYQPAPFAVPLKFSEERTSKFGSKNLYGSQSMFHGPSMRSVTELTRVGRREIVGTVKSRHPAGWFASNPDGVRSSDFQIDPLLLDNASQLVLFHLFEHDLAVQALLPFHIESIEFFGRPEATSTPVTVQAQLHAISETSTQATVEIIRTTDNNERHIWTKLNGITSRRVTMPEGVSAYISDPGRIHLTEDLPNVALSLKDPHRWSCVRLDGRMVPGDRALLDWLADYVLSTREQEFYLAELRSDNRKREWLMGRIAAKDSLRTLLYKQCGINVCPADIEILQGDNGLPAPAGKALAALGWAPWLSISHKGDIAIAIAGRPDGEKGVGIDIEGLRPLPDGFEQLGLNASDIAKLENASNEERTANALRMWCAREALGKALNIGLAEQMKRIRVEQIDPAPGKLVLSLLNTNGVAGADTNENSFVVQTFLNGGHVVAVTVCERS